MIIHGFQTVKCLLDVKTSVDKLKPQGSRLPSCQIKSGRKNECAYIVNVVKSKIFIQ